MSSTGSIISPIKYFALFYIDEDQLGPFRSPDPSVVEHLAYSTNEDVGWVLSNNKYDFPGGDLGYIFVPETVPCAEDFSSIQSYPPNAPKAISEDSGSSIVCTTGMYFFYTVQKISCFLLHFCEPTNQLFSSKFQCRK